MRICAVSHARLAAIESKWLCGVTWRQGDEVVVCNTSMHIQEHGGGAPIVLLRHQFIERGPALRARSTVRGDGTGGAGDAPA